MINLQQSIQNLISQRSQQWQTHDRAVDQSQQLHRRFQQSYYNANATETISPLTTQQLPHEEVVAVIAELEQVDQAIVTQQQHIHANLQQLEQYKRKARNLIISLSIFAVLALGMLILSLKNQSESPKSPQAFVPTTLRQGV